MVVALPLASVVAMEEVEVPNSVVMYVIVLV